MASRGRKPTLIAPGSRPRFPDPREADDEGLLAVGGDLSVPRLLHAYDEGIFPWYDEGLPPLWWSPNPRAILDLRGLEISRSMRRFLKRHRFTISANRAFYDVMVGCAARPDTGTWILPEVIVAYCQLHRFGHAHSFEVWDGGDLVGGLYGVQRGGLFAAESMFHRRSNASKLALIVSVSCLFKAGIRLFDVQFVTPHLLTMGAVEIPREEYLRRLARARRRPTSLIRSRDIGGLWAP